SLHTAATDTALVRSLTGMKMKSLEGFLYPDTYQFPIDCGADSILGIQTAEFFRKLSRAGINPHAIPDFYQKLILASIVEKEAGNDDERGIIAGVFQNRLKLGMALQSCPTVDYILEQRGIRREVLTTKDTEIPSPYNTYMNPGLPPTPICNPRLESIQAALHPTLHNYLYFFSDRQGNNVFSSSFEEHQRLQRKLGL
ncbi:MAG TPA: endolytic transglycosylase MltG, partial [Candidatus Cloacimonadota bacterium]|nr:endolytic transglycosylase MltG [Candidatus Cloacimonadota bacterium]